MRVEVLRVVDPSRGTVSFTSDFGAASGRWMGPNPARAGQFDVEIEVPEEVTEWATLASDVTALSEGAGADPGILITGEVVRVGGSGDPVVEIRVGSDIVLIEIPDRRSEVPVAGMISLRVPEILLYPYDL